MHEGGRFRTCRPLRLACFLHLSWIAVPHIASLLSHGCVFCLRISLETLPFLSHVGQYESEPAQVTSASRFDGAADFPQPRSTYPASSGGFVTGRTPHFHFWKSFRMNVIPSHSDEAFGAHRPLPTRRQVVPVLPSRLLPAFTGQDFITTTESSATSHRIERP